MTIKVSPNNQKKKVLMSKNVEKTSNFFSEVIGLKLIHQTDTMAELKDQKDFRLIIKHSPK